METTTTNQEHSTDPSEIEQTSPPVALEGDRAIAIKVRENGEMFISLDGEFQMHEQLGLMFCGLAELSKKYFAPDNSNIIEGLQAIYNEVTKKASDGASQVTPEQQEKMDKIESLISDFKNGK